MNRIEFIGAPGVGKTFLLNAILNNNYKRNWCTFPEAKIEIAKSIGDFKNPYSNKYLMQFDHFKNKYDKWFNDNLNLFYVAAEKNYLPAFCDIILETMQFYLSEKIKVNNSYQRLQYIDYNIELIKQLTFLIHSSFNKNIVFCEFIVHNLPVFIDYDSLSSKIKEDEFLRKTLLPKAVIYCYTDINENFARRKKRITNGQAGFIDYKLSDEEVREQCLINLNRSENMRNVLEKIGVPILDVDTTDSTDENIKKINSFINSL